MVTMDPSPNLSPNLSAEEAASIPYRIPSMSEARRRAEVFRRMIEFKSVARQKIWIEGIPRPDEVRRLTEEIDSLWDAVRINEAWMRRG